MVITRYLTGEDDPADPWNWMDAAATDARQEFGQEDSKGARLTAFYVAERHQRGPDYVGAGPPVAASLDEMAAGAGLSTAEASFGLGWLIGRGWLVVQGPDRYLMVYPDDAEAPGRVGA